jgi:DNA-binding NarL/FixJ family response regulator
MLSGVALYRAAGRERFGSYERHVVHVVVGNIRGMHMAHVPGRAATEVLELTPRLRTVLTLLIDGRKRSEIARMLGLSEHTVKDHTKSVFRHFGVSKHAELLRRFQFGDGEAASEESDPPS